MSMLATCLAATTNLASHIRRTPILRTQLFGHSVVLKLEHLQLGGSFKIRGAFSRLLGESCNTVTTASGGNHGIAVALAAAQLYLPATVFMPERAPQATQRRIESLGAKCVRGGLAWDDAWAEAERFAAIHQSLLVHPFEDSAVIAGQSTLAQEFIEAAPEIDGLLVAIGGGGLAAGTVLVAGGRPVVGVEPLGAPSMQASIAAAGVVALAEVNTIAGTLAPRSVGPTTYAICSAGLSEIVLVSDDELRDAMRVLWNELRILVEPAGAAAVAALLSGRMNTTMHRPGVIICGANPDDAEVRRLFVS